MPEVYKHRLYKCAASVICKHEYKYSIPAFYIHREVIIERTEESRGPTFTLKLNRGILSVHREAIFYTDQKGALLK